MNNNKYNTKSTISKALIIALVIVSCLATYAIGTEASRIQAESVYADAWVLCKDYLIIRAWPSRKATEAGLLDPCDKLEIDGRTRDGFAHIVSPVDGWVWAGNIVFSEPVKVDRTAVVTARNRVACRRWVDGPQVESKPWLINGSEVRVYFADSEWACTSRGYIKTEWLELMAE